MSIENGGYHPRVILSGKIFTCLYFSVINFALTIFEDELKELYIDSIHDLKLVNIWVYKTPFRIPTPEGNSKFGYFINPQLTSYHRTDKHSCGRPYYIIEFSINRIIHLTPPK